MFRVSFVIFTASLFVAPYNAYAILPPDIIFSVGHQFAQFFSVSVLFIGGVAGSVIIFLRPRINFIRNHIYAIVCALLFITAMSILGIYFAQELANSKKYLEQIEALNHQIDEATRVITTVSTSTKAFATSTDPEEAWETLKDARRLFMSDTLYLYGNDAGSPLYLEIDLNRRQVPNGTFMHYYYTVGVYDGLDRYSYDLVYSTSTVPVLTESIPSLVLLPFSDLSPREEYQGTIQFDETQVTFTALNLQGDFLTRNSPTYTRHQSVGDGIVTYHNKEIPVHVLAEGIYSSDFLSSVFFEGSDAVVSETRQFVLWDSEGNFYMIDQSNAALETPAYHSHTWLLYKNTMGYAKKGFTSNITAQSVLGRPETAWSITAPDLNEANLQLSLVRYIDDGDSQARMRALVKGIVTDDNGQRDISGFAFMIKKP